MLALRGSLLQLDWIQLDKFKQSGSGKLGVNQGQRGTLKV